ncbi:MAG: phosphotransacetylase family protein [Halobacteriales archaeon]|nr:phosphotransacetylase family protein [Halobacteriales archaeon]
MRTLLVTSTAESTGKTAITIAIGLLGQESGKPVGYMKPKGTRLQSNVGKTLDEDPILARELLEFEAEVHEMEPIVYSPTFIEGAIRGQETAATLHERIETQFDQLAVDRELMLLEGGGSLTTGGIVDITDIDIAELLNASVLLVTEYDQPRDVDDILAAAERLGDRLAGILFNRVADAQFDRLEADVVPFLENRGMPVMGILPRRHDLAGVTVTELADELGAQLLTDSGGDRFVERFSVGAMGADTALQYFRRTRNAAVITGGDRPEIQVAALEAPGINCLILTGGHHPPETVLGKATEKGVPIMTVTTDTLTTVERAEEIVRSGRTRDEHTVRQMRDLLAEHSTIDQLLNT